MFKEDQNELLRFVASIVGAIIVLGGLIYATELARGWEVLTQYRSFSFGGYWSEAQSTLFWFTVLDITVIATGLLLLYSVCHSLRSVNRPFVPVRVNPETLTSKQKNALEDDIFKDIGNLVKRATKPVAKAQTVKTPVKPVAKRTTKRVAKTTKPTAFTNLVDSFIETPKK